MSDLRFAGIHWPANAGGEHPNVETILGMPGIMHGCTLICADSARYWYKQARAASPFVVWRAIPRQGRLPAQLGWNAQRVADECLNLWDEQPHGGTEWFLPLNELQFVKENGAPFPGYGPMAQNLAGLRVELRKRFSGTGVRLMFPAWVPSDDGTYLSDWRGEAMQWDAICLHAYGSAEAMQARYLSYRSAFPDHGIFVGEHNANHEGHDEYAALSMWAEVADTDTGFLGATYYIWETHNAGEGDLSIWGYPDRLALFQHPPTVEAPVEPPVEPEAPPMTRDEVIALIVSKANEHGLVPWEFLGGAIAESGLDPQAWRQGVWPDWSAGLYQQTVAFADEGDHSPSEANVALIKSLYFDPVHACDVAAVKFRYWRYNPEVPALTAWVAYNGPSFYHTPEESPNVENYRRSLTTARGILGVPDPVVGGNRLYVPDVPAEVIRQQNNWSCAVRSTYAALWSLAQKGLIEPVTYGDEGPRDVYEWMVPEFDDPSVGLHRADGSGLVECLGRHGITAHAEYPTTLAAVQQRAGYQPILLGGRAWVHWVMVNGLEPDGTLILENPAPGFGGISDEIRDSFTRLGPMTMVWIDEPQVPVPVPPQPPVVDEPESYEELQTLVGVAYHDDGTVVPALVAAAKQTDLAQMKQQVEAVVSFLKSNNPDRAA